MPSTAAARLVSVFVVTLLVGIPGACAQTAWQTVEALNGLFTVEMPAKPAYRLQKATSGGGTEFDYHSYTLDQDKRAFVAQTATYPVDVDVTDPKKNLESALAASAQHLQTKKWDRLTWTTFNGVPAVSSVGKMNDKLEFRNLLLLKDHQMYSLAYAGPPGTTGSADVERFFKSLRLKK